MRITRRTARILVALCLLIVQAQLFAGSALGCRHLDQSASDPTSAGCPLHAAEALGLDNADSAPLLDCQKCALHCAIGVNAQMAAEIGVLMWQPQARPDRSPERHFYQFTPESSFKPPTARLS